MLKIRQELKSIPDIDIHVSGHGQKMLNYFLGLDVFSRSWFNQKYWDLYARFRCIFETVPCSIRIDDHDQILVYIAT